MAQKMLTYLSIHLDSDAGGRGSQHIIQTRPGPTQSFYILLLVMLLF